VSTWKQALDATRRAAAAYDALDQVRLGRSWTFSELLAGATTDLGDLSRLLLIEEGTRPGERDTDSIGHQLADLFWDIVVIADRLKIDLPAVISSSMNALADRVEQRVIGNEATGAGD
jgi:NTP pyrophosphatase (non-canonical NTP hydrolase)